MKRPECKTEKMERKEAIQYIELLIMVFGLIVIGVLAIAL